MCKLFVSKVNSNLTLCLFYDILCVYFIDWAVFDFALLLFIFASFPSFHVYRLVDKENLNTLGNQGNLLFLLQKPLCFYRRPILVILLSIQLEANVID